MRKQISFGLLILSTLSMGCRSTASSNHRDSILAAVQPVANFDHSVALQEEVTSENSWQPVTTASSLTVKESAPVEDQALSDFDIAGTQSIDLTTALMMTTGNNPQIAFAKARIEEALAQLDRANALKLPSLRAGVNYNKHEGRIQDVAGTVIETSRGSFYSGLGADAVGAGSPAVPGIVSQFHFADAIFQPRIAQRAACARQAGALATTNDQLLAAALAYNDLLRSEQDLAVVNEIVVKAEQLASATAEFAKAGQGLESDHDRARTELSLRRNEQVRAEEVALVASARLAEIIRWDNSLRLIPSETQIVPIELVNTSASSQDLVAQALSHRPELAESRHLVGEAVERLKRERNAPLVPSVLLAASYGGLGGGLGSSLTNYGDRFDADAVAFWELRQLGMGEQAAQREARSQVTQARTREIATMDRIAREVSESKTQVQSRKRQIEMTQDAVQAAEDSFDKNWDRIRNGQGLPIEVLQAIQALAMARREYVRSVADYNQAQFSLQRSLGWPINDDSIIVR